MTRLLGELRTLNELGDRRVAEPFAGGAGASLSLLYREETHHIYINDADPALRAFWWTLVNRPQSFAKLLSETPVTIAEWHRQRQVYRSVGAGYPAYTVASQPSTSTGATARGSL